MKLGISSLAMAAAAAAALAILGDQAAAASCPTLRVTARAPRAVRNNKLYSVAVAVKNTGTTAANNVQIAMTLPAGVLYKSQTGHPKSGAGTFAQNGQYLTWSNINLGKRGAAQTLRLKVNVTNCADGQLAFGAGVTVNSGCPVAATPATATVKHAKGWVACPPSELCSTPTGTPGVYACAPGRTICHYIGDDYGSIPTLADCFTACQGTAGLTFVEYYPNGGGCNCVATVLGSREDTDGDLYAIGEARTPIEGDCSGRRLSSEPVDA